MQKKYRVISISLVAIIIVVVLGGFLNIHAKNRLTAKVTADYQQREVDISEQIAGNLVNEVGNVVRQLTIMAAMPEIQNGSEAVCNTKLKELLSISEVEIGNLARVGPDGTFRCSINKTLIGIKAEKLGDYIPKLFKDPNHQPVLSKAILPPGAAAYVAAVHVPVFDANKEFIGSLGGAISLTRIQDRFLKNVQLADHGFVILFDENGDVLYHPQTQLIGKNLQSDEVKKLFNNITPVANALQNAKTGQSGTLDWVTMGEKGTGAYKPAGVLPDHKWIVFTAVPTKDVGQSINKLGINSAFLLMSLTLVGSIVAVALILMSNILKLLSLQNNLNLEKSRAQTLLSSIGDGVIAIDRDWKITLFNEAAANLTGWEIAETIGKPLREVLSLIRENDRVEDVTFIEEAMLYGKTKHLEQSMILIRKDKHEILIGDSAAPIKSHGGEINGAVIVFRSTAEEHAKQRLTSDFAFASHQFRTPLTQALTAISLAESETKIEDMKEDLKMATVGLRSMHELIVKSLAMSDIEGGRLAADSKPVNIGKVVDEVWKRQEAGPNMFELKTDIKNGDAVLTDPVIIDKILTELMQNAVNYSRHHSAIEISGKQTDNTYLIEIKTKGEPISSEEVPLIFTKFFRGANKPADSIGSGLGLYLVKEYVKLLKGKVWLSSKDDETIFKFSLPSEDSKSA